MKIVFFGNATSIHVQRWVKWFAKRGHEVHVFTFVDGKIEDVDVHHINIKLKHLPFAQQVSLPLETGRIRRTIREINPNIVQGHHVTNFGLLPACARFHALVLTAWGSHILIGLKQSSGHMTLSECASKKAELSVDLDNKVITTTLTLKVVQRLHLVTLESPTAKLKSLATFCLYGIRQWGGVAYSSVPARTRGLIG